MPNKAILWFHQDLRLQDNPALKSAAGYSDVIPVFIFDKRTQLGAASEWWLHHSLTALNASMRGNLNIFSGCPEELLPALAKKLNVSAVFWNRCYEAWEQKTEAGISEKLAEAGIETVSCKVSLLWEPWEILKSDQTPYRIFTPYYKQGCLSALSPAKPQPAPREVKFSKLSDSLTVDDLKLLPDRQWHRKLQSHWKPGELGAHEQLNGFLRNGIHTYAEGRDLPSSDSASRLSPHLHFGEISPAQLWWAVDACKNPEQKDSFRRQLAWRDFAYYQLHHAPHIVDKNLRSEFDDFPWKEDAKALKSWQTGRTGYPIIDAGMRELWETGYMHNRVRMIVASFLVKNLMIHWKEGADWFYDCLVDADVANNAMGWQWVAGTGVDAAPYFRIFNPILQSRKFDPKAEYIRKWVPELASLPAKHAVAPHEAPKTVLKEAGVKLGRTYPYPIVDLALSRARALDAFNTIKKKN